VAGAASFSIFFFFLLFLGPPLHGKARTVLFGVVFLFYFWHAAADRAECGIIHFHFYLFFEAAAARGATSTSTSALSLSLSWSSAGHAGIEPSDAVSSLLVLADASQPQADDPVQLPQLLGPLVQRRRLRRLQAGQERE
jgi:hypothetical protein